jgi:hypothetical protein
VFVAVFLLLRLPESIRPKPTLIQISARVALDIADGDVVRRAVSHFAANALALLPSINFACVDGYFVAFGINVPEINLLPRETNSYMSADYQQRSSQHLEEVVVPSRGRA